MSRKAYRVSGAALRRAEVLLASLPAAQVVPADGVSKAPSLGASLYQVGDRP